MNTRMHLEVMPPADANQVCKEHMITTINRFHDCSNKKDKRLCLSSLKQDARRSFDKALDIDINASRLPYCNELHQILKS